MNYKELLSKYIEHVKNCNGLNFTDNEWIKWGGVIFTLEEIQELQNLPKENVKDK